MGRKLSICFILVRLLQLLGAFIPAAMNGWLLAYIHSNNLEPSKILLVLEVLVAAVFVYTASTVLIVHSSQRSRKAVWLICSLGFDLLLCFVNVAIVSLLSFTGLPSNCSGLNNSSVCMYSTNRPLPARTTYSPVESKTLNKRGKKAKVTPESKADQPSSGYTIFLFGNEQEGQRGELDRFCGIERGFFFCTLLVILAYIVTMMMSLYRIFDLHYTRNSKIQHLLDEREEMPKLELKMQEQEAGLPPRQAALGPSGRLQDYTTAASAADGEAAIVASMTRPAGQPQPMSSTRFVSDNGGASSPALPLIVIPEVGGSSVVVAAAAAAVETASVDSTAVEANLAMISDGSRYGTAGRSGHQPVDHNQLLDHNQLPPYTPGNQRTMSGHGIESSDMLLSGYVKGETRAQDMKDAGGF